MILRKLLLFLFYAVVAAGIGFYVYQSHPHLVWGLLLLCWICYRMKMRADNLFGARRMAIPTSIPVSGRKGGELPSSPDLETT